MVDHLSRAPPAARRIGAIAGSPVLFQQPPASTTPMFTRARRQRRAAAAGAIARQPVVQAHGGQEAGDLDRAAAGTGIEVGQDTAQNQLKVNTVHRASCATLAIGTSADLNPSLRPRCCDQYAGLGLETARRRYASSATGTAPAAMRSTTLYHMTRSVRAPARDYL
jgi:hypothetical protein